MSVLVVTPSVPWPPTHGAAVRNSAFITALAEQYDVDVLTLAGPRERVRPHPNARSTTAVRLRRAPLWRRLANAAVGSTPDLVIRHRTPELRAAVQQRLSAGGIDVVQVEGLQLAHIVHDVAAGAEGANVRPKVVFDAHNVEWLLQSQLANLARRARAWHSGRQAALLYAVERWVVGAADAVVASSAADAASLATLGNRSVSAIAHPVPVPVDPPGVDQETDQPRVLLAANFAYRPNILGAEWLFGRVWPAVLRRVPAAKLRVVGPGSLSLRAIAPARCSVGGLVDDFRAEQRAAWLSTSPAPVGSGAPLKVLQSLAQARPVVVRATGLAGLPRSLAGIAAADSAGAFADALSNLLQDHARRHAMGRRGHAFVLANHAPGGCGTRASGCASWPPKSTWQRRRRMTVAVCATVLNEVRDAAALAESIGSQHRLPDELVIVDGGSSDGTAEILRKALADVPGAKVIDAPGANISVGRNLAARETQAELIAFTDAGIMRSPGWLGALIEAAERAPSAAGAFGYILASPGNTVETAIGAVGLPFAGEIDPAHYPPSGGSMLLRRQWFERIGGFPEWLDYGEDLWLDRRIWAEGGWFVHASGADVRNRPRSSLPAFFRQYYNYAWGDGRADMLGKRHAARFAAYAVGLALARRPTWARTALLLFLGYRYVRRPIARAQGAPSSGSAAAALVPFVRVVGDVAKMLGYAAGCWRRLRD